MKKAKDLKLDDTVYVEFSHGGILEMNVDSLNKKGDIIQIHIGGRKHVFHIQENQSQKTEGLNGGETLYINRDHVVSKIISNQEKRVSELEGELLVARNRLKELKNNN